MTPQQSGPLIGIGIAVFVILLLGDGLTVAQRIKMFIRARRIMAGAPNAHVEVVA